MNVVFNRELHSVPLLLFEKLAVERGCATWRRSKWRTDARDLESLVDVEFRYADHSGDRSARVSRPSAIGYVWLERGGDVDVTAAAANQAALDALLDEIRSAIPAADEHPPGEANVRFWTMGSHDSYAISRKVALTGWTSIRANYAAPVASVMDSLVLRDTPPSGGQLMLWHGPPGTGKTHAIRALINEWRAWIRPEYVVDPEAFFGGSANYIMSVLLGELDENDASDNAWRLLIFEDTGELLAADAKERLGQGLSRMLNTVDGLLGQGLRVLVLITTNEDLDRLHPAVTRAGRCSINLRFARLDRATAEHWAAAHDVRLPAGSSFTVSDLFALLEGRPVNGAPEPIGFAFTRN